LDRKYRNGYTSTFNVPSPGERWSNGSALVAVRWGAGVGIERDDAGEAPR